MVNYSIFVSVTLAFWSNYISQFQFSCLLHFTTKYFKVFLVVVEPIVVVYEVIT